MARVFKDLDQEAREAVSRVPWNEVQVIDELFRRAHGSSLRTTGVHSYDYSCYSRRKLRLFLVACCRNYYNELTLPSGRSRPLSNRARRYVDECLDRLTASAEFDSGGFSFKQEPTLCDLHRAEAHTIAHARSLIALRDAANVDLHFCHWNTNGSTGSFASLAVDDSRCDLFRDIFPDPARFSLLDAFIHQMRNSDTSRFLGGTAQAMAADIYLNGRWDLFPILGDVFQDAGLESSFILDHCYSPLPHVRGCWLVDAILLCSKFNPFPESSDGTQPQPGSRSGRRSTKAGSQSAQSGTAP